MPIIKRYVEKYGCDYKVILFELSKELIDSTIDEHQTSLIKAMAHFTQLLELLTVSESVSNMVINKLNKGKGKGYCAATLCDASHEMITQLLGSIGVTDAIQDMHMTLMYDVRNPKLQQIYAPVLVGQIKDIKMMGDPSSQWRSIAFELECDDAVRFNDILISNLGYKHSYPDFIPHMSIKYRAEQKDIDKLMNNKEMFLNMFLIFDMSYWEKNNVN